MRRPHRATPPELRPRITYDEEGQLTIYTGKHCAAPGCGLLLTSRNRFQGKLACMEHGREIERERYLAKKELRASGALPPVRPRTKKPVPGLPTIPDGLLTALKLWLNHPDDSYAQEMLRRATDNYELNARLRKMLPAVPAPAWRAPSTDGLPSIDGLPVEDPLPIDSPHRLTQGEFLADCNTYGV